MLSPAREAVAIISGIANPQYMSTKRFITVDWSKLAGTYDKTFGTKGPAGEVRPPTAGGVGAWFVDFLTANFQREFASHVPHA